MTYEYNTCLRLQSYAQNSFASYQFLFKCEVIQLHESGCSSYVCFCDERELVW